MLGINNRLTLTKIEMKIKIIISFLTLLYLSATASDLRINQVIFPTSNIDENTEITFLWEVENIRPVTSSEYTTHVVLKDSDDNIVFEEYKLMAGLTGFHKENVVTNNSWTATPSGSYTLTLWIDNANDIDTTNNGFIFTFTVDAVPNPCPSGPANLIEPLDLDLNVHPDSVLFFWTLPGDQDMVKFYYSSDSSLVANSDASVLAASGEALQSYVPNDLNYNRKYFWKVVVFCGEAYIDSDIYRFSTIICPSSPATNLYPSSGTLHFDLTDSLKWVNPGDQDMVELYLSDDSSKVANFAPETFIAAGPNLNYYTVSDLEIGIKYYWRVAVYCEEASLNTAINSFTTRDGCASGPATNFLPANNSQIIFTDYVDNGLNLTWTNPGDQTNVELYFSTDKNLVASRSPNAFVASGPNLQQYSLPDSLYPNKTYYWAVVEYCYNEFVEFSPSKFYLITSENDFCSYSVDDMIPHDDSKVSIENSDSNSISLLGVFLDKEFNSFADSAEFFISKSRTEVENEDPQAQVLLESKNFISQGKGVISDQLTNLEQGSEYFWKVVIYCKIGESISSNIFSFFTKTCFSFNHWPSNYSSPLFLSTLTQLEWELSNDVTDGLNVYFSSDSILVAQHDPSVNILSTLTPATKASLPELNPNTNYYWTVVLNCDPDTETQVYSFLTASCTFDPPYELKTLDMEDNRKDTLFYRGVRLNWKFSEPPGVDKILIYVHPNIQLVADADSSAFLVSVPADVNTYEIGELTPGIKYYWTTVVECGEVKLISQVDSFVTSNNCESVIEPTPNNNSVNIPIDFYSLDWTDPSNAERYEVQFSEDLAAIYDGSSSTVFTGGTTDTFFDIGRYVDIEKDKTYYWRVISYCTDGTTPVTPFWKFSTETTTGVKISDEIPTEFSLSQNYPNPFNPTTKIRFALPEPSDVKIEIYNTIGELVSVAYSGNQSAGIFEVNFDALRLASGVYLYRMRAAGVSGKLHVSYKKMTVLK